MYWVTGILGFLLLLTPWTLGFGNNAMAFWTCELVGLGTMIVSLTEGMQADKNKWEYWISGILGFIAIFAPFIFGFSSYINATIPSILIGVLISLFAISRLTLLRKY